MSRKGQVFRSRCPCPRADLSSLMVRMHKSLITASLNFDLNLPATQHFLHRLRVYASRTIGHAVCPCRRTCLTRMKSRELSRSPEFNPLSPLINNCRLFRPTAHYRSLRRPVGGMSSRLFRRDLRLGINAQLRPIFPFRLALKQPR
jgi:hypothetical protein